MKKSTVLATLFCLVSVSLAAQPVSSVSPDVRALHENALNGNLQEVQRLVSEGTAAAAVDEEKRNALMWAAYNGHTTVVEYLHGQGVDPDAKDNDGRTALLFASSGPFPETVDYLLKQGVEVNVQGTAEGFTALMMAAAEGQLKVVQLLLEHGARTEMKDRDGDTAQSFAMQNGHSAVVKILGSG